MTVRYSVYVPNFAEYGDPRVLLDLARRAENAGWDGLFIWDHLTLDRRAGIAVADPWVLLTAVALSTERIRFGTLVTPVARRRPAKLARETTTLDLLSGGRLVLGVGLGAPISEEYGVWGEPTDPRVLAERLDEGLEVLTGLWTGDPVQVEGRHYVARDVAFAPTPHQRPRIPIWVGGVWPHRAPLRRAARFDGAAPILDEGVRQRPPKPAQLPELCDVVLEQRGSLDGFEIVLSGETRDDAQGRELVSELAAGGATWWNESLNPWRCDLDAARRRIEAGPPA